mgnify:CR=1 FL=1
MNRMYFGSDRDLITLFTYDGQDDLKAYCSSWSSMCINKKTGELVTRHFNQPVYNVMGTTVSSYLSDWDEFKRILNTRKIAKSVRNRPWNELNENNWLQWLNDNGYIKEK